MKRICLLMAVVGIGCTLFHFRRPTPSLTTSRPAIAAVESGSSDTSSASNRVLQQGPAFVRPTYASTNANAPTNLLAKLLKLKGEPPRISHEQADSFASANGRRADALLAAWSASGDDTFLREAMEKFPTE